MDPNSCLICGSKDYDIRSSYDQPDRYELAVGVGPEGYFRRWVQCEQCSFIYSIYSRAQDVFDELYKTVYRNNDSSWRKESGEELFKKIISLGEDESETKFRIKWIREVIESLQNDQVIDKKSPPHNFLDIGGGSGVFAYEFKDASWRPYVVDPDDRGSFMKNYGIEFFPDYYRPHLFPVKFDLISLIYVLEHLQDPISVIKGLHQDMNPGALLYIEVPDSICFKRKDPQDDIFNSCHLWMFSPYTISRFLHDAGFEILALNRIKAKRGYYGLMVLAVSNQLD